MSASDRLPPGAHPLRLEGRKKQNRLVDSCESSKTIARRMRQSLRQTPPFQGLVTPHSEQDDAGDGLLDSLLDAVATSLHVLDFYNNRIAAEGYLHTATEDRSILSLVEPLGVRPRPPVAASTYLSFTAYALAGDGPATTVSAGTGVQSIPEPGFLPQVFETVEALEIRVPWNAMTPIPSSAHVAPHLWSHTTAAVVRGTAPMLKVGARVLVTGERDGAPYWSVQAIARITRMQRRGLTLVSWDQPLIPHEPPHRIERAEVRLLGPQVPMFGADANAWDRLTLDEQLRFSPRVGGMSIKLPDSDLWQAVVLPNSAARVLCLFHARDGTLYAGLDGQGLLKSVDHGHTWKTSGRGLRRAAVLCITENTAGHILVGTRQKGVQTSRDGGETWNEIRGTSGVRQAWPVLRRVANRLPPGAVRSIVCFTSERSAQTVSYILAGTDSGLFCFEQGTGHWRPLHKSLPMVVNDAEQADFSIRSVVVRGGSGEVFIGTDHGLWSTTRLGTVWDARDPRSPGAAVRSLTIDDSDNLYACLDTGGFYRSDDAGQTWLSITGLPNSPFIKREIRHVLHLPSSSGQSRWVFAVTDDGLWRSSDSGLTWKLTSEGLHDQSLETMTITSTGALIVCAPRLDSLHDDWPGFGLTPERFELARDIGDIAPGSPLLLEQTDPETARVRRLLLHVERSARTDIDRFGLRKRASRIRLHAIEDLETFARRWAQVRVPARPVRLSALQVSRPGPIADPHRSLEELLAPAGVFESITADEQAMNQVPRDTLEFTENLTELEDRSVGIRGRPLRVVLRVSVEMRDDRTQATQTFGPGTTLTVISWPSPTEDGTGHHWMLRSLHGFEGSARLTPDEVKICPADPDATELTVLRRVRFAEAMKSGSRLHLDRPLDAFLDISTMTVFGNVVEARQGRTVEEVLGSGNASLAGQRFQVRQTPVSWYVAEGDLKCDLEVRVSGQLWHHVDDFQAHGSDAHVYTVSTDHAGKTWVTFGDGWNGSRLPSGLENVRATFKMGAGPAGNARTGQVRLLRSRDPGLRRATNLVPATGGDPMENAESLRQRAPIAARTLDRVISLRDLEDFLQSMPDVAQVDARMVWGGDRRLLHVSMSTGDATVSHRMLEDSPLATSVRALLSRFGMDSTGISVASYVPSFFCIELELLVHPDQSPEPILRESRARLASHFEFAARRMGQPVTMLEIVSLLMPINGLLNVRVASLRQEADGPRAPSDAVPAALPAALAHWSHDSQKVISSQMLLLHPGRGLEIRVVGERT